MSDLSSRILIALDEAIAQEVAARLRQAAQNVPSESRAPGLPDRRSTGIPQKSATFGNDTKARAGSGLYLLSVDEVDDGDRASTRLSQRRAATASRISLGRRHAVSRNCKPGREPSCPDKV